MFDRKKILILTERIEKNAVRSLLAKMLGEKMKNDESEDVIRTTIYEAKIVAEITKFAQWVEKCLLECYSEKILTHSVSRTTILRLMKQRLQLLTLLRTINTYLTTMRLVGSHSMLSLYLIFSTISKSHSLIVV